MVSEKLGAMASRHRKWLFIVLILLAALVLTELLLQLAYRAKHGDFLFRRAALPIFRSDPHLGWGVKPDLDYHHHTPEFSVRYRVNAQGFRTPSGMDRGPKPENTYRILLMGPSFAFGWGVDYEDSYAFHLEQALALATGRRVEVLNAGVPALPAPAFLEWYESVGREYEPDMILLLTYGTLLAVDPEPTSVDDRGYLVRTLSPKARVLARAKNVALVFYGYQAYLSLWGGPSADQEVEGAGRKLPPTVSTFDPDSPGFQPTRQVYERWRAAATRDGARLVVVFAPLSYQVHEADLARWKRRGVTQPEAQRAWNRESIQWLNERVECYDLCPGLRAYAEESEERLYYPLDIHWTPEGNRRAAQETARQLKGLEVN